MKRSTNLVTFGGNPVTLLGKSAKVGINAKNFICIGQDLKHVKLSDFSGKVRIISSVPSVDTGVCSAQTLRFNKEADKLKNVQIITVSVDLPFALKRFCEAEGVKNIAVISDHKDLDFAVKYGLLIEEYRLLARAIIVIDREDIIRHVQIVKEIGEHPDYDKALAVVKKFI